MTVHLVGAGPGDPELLTLRAARLLAQAEVVVHDRLVSPLILGHAAGARLIDVGKSPGEPSGSQQSINTLLVDLGRHGIETVRLKGGDPFVFGRGGEEAEALAAAGVSYTVVPGVSAALAAPMMGGAPVTHRGMSRSVAIVTGHDERGELSAVDWPGLFEASDSLVILMGAAQFGSIARQLIEAGADPDTAVLAVTRAGWES